MAGIYVHIPFCKQACAYCNFHFATSLRYKAELLAALITEFEIKFPEMRSHAPLQSVYFGGGTPSILDESEFDRLLNPMLQQISFDTNVEVTLEANPDDITTKKVKSLMRSGVNRLSIGVQSFHDTDLRFMNRAHNGVQAADAVKIAQDAGIENISIDLIYGVPGASQKQWLSNIQKAIDLQVPHISSYALTIEENTPLYKSIRLNEKLAPLPDATVEQYQQLVQQLLLAGFEHYEISNFAKPNYHAIHNSSYWNGERYWGLGPSAHSFDGHRKRSWNIANNQQYIMQLGMNKLPEEVEILEAHDVYNEMVMIGLRTSKGVSIPKMKSCFGDKVAQHFFNQMETAFQYENAAFHNDCVTLSSKGRMMADAIMRDAFLSQRELESLNR